MTEYRGKILELTRSYYSVLDEEDFSHDFNHVLRVERMVKRIGREEEADMEVLEASALLFDVARDLEDKGKCDDHAVKGAEIAEEVLTEIGFPKSKISEVCHAIRSHRKSKNRKPRSVEAKILQDADYLECLGAIDVARVIASSLQSEKYKRPIYVEKEYEGEEDKNLSAIHYIKYKLSMDKLKPCNFHTRMGRRLARERRDFLELFVKKFINEWKGVE